MGTSFFAVRNKQPIFILLFQALFSLIGGFSSSDKKSDRPIPCSSDIFNIANFSTASEIRPAQQKTDKKEPAGFC